MCYVDNGGVRGDIAGGFVGDFQSGIVENDENNALCNTKYFIC